jgi:hypothetical protein
MLVVAARSHLIRVNGPRSEFAGSFLDGMGNLPEIALRQRAA